MASWSGFKQPTLAHGYSFNTWSDVVTYTPEFIQEWLDSPQTSMYYSLQVMQDTQAKDDALAALEGTDFKTNVRLSMTPATTQSLTCLMTHAACVGCAE